MASWSLAHSSSRSGFGAVSAAAGSPSAGSAPTLATAYAPTPNDSLTVLDLKNGQTRQYQRFDLRDGGFTNLIASPDGKHLFAQGGMEQLVRYRIDGTKVSVVDRTERIAQNGQSVCVSPDGAFVCLPSGGGNYNLMIAGIGVLNYGTYVFRTNDLKVPAFSLASGAYPRLVGFDPRAGLAYAQNHDSTLIVFTTKGVKQQEYRLGLSREDPMQFLAHPEGKKLFVLTPGTLYWCELGVATPPMPGLPIPPLPPGGPPRLVATPEPRATNDILAGGSRKVDDADVTTVRVSPRDLLEGMCWAADGKSLYCVERSGVVRRIALNGLKEEARLDIGRTCYNLALSSEGPVVAVLEGAGEVWLLDAQSLKVKRRVAIATLTRVTAAPSLAVAFAVSMGAASEQVNVIDLKEGKVLKRIHKPDAGEAGFSKAIATPDGKYLFGVNNGILHRFRVENDQLIFEESGPKPNTVRTSSQPLCTDGRYVFMPMPPTPTAARTATIPLYEVSNLQKPVVTLELGPFLPTTVGFDPKGKAFYASMRDGTLTVFDADGRIKKKYALETSMTRYARHLLVHPDGDKLVLANLYNVFWVELPK